MKPVFLWTDVLIWLLVVMAVLGARYSARQPHLRRPWRRVMRSPMAMGSALVLVLFLLVALLDSLHYRPALDNNGAQGEVHYAVEVRSVLDDLLRPIQAANEKTYSAPLAVQGLTREFIDDGVSARRDYPRLTHGGAHLEDPAQRDADLRQRSEQGVLGGVVVWLVIAVVWWFWARRKRALQQADPAEQRADRRVYQGVLAVALLLCVLGGIGVMIAGSYHLFGTDKVGQDVLYQAIKGIRTGLVIGTLTTLIMLPFAIVLGVAAGYFRGWVDDVIQYLYTTLNSIPGVLLIAAAVLLIQVYIDQNPGLFETTAERADLRLLFLCLILGVTSWTGLCRLLRGETLKLRELDYITAAQSFGVSPARILARHIVPNVMHVVLITVVLDFSGLVLAEAVLSYVGVGVDPAMISWGNMINAARLEMAREPVVWWTLAAAFLFMFALVLAANLFADVVRAAFDPRLQRQGE
ncbi:MAG: ABC transporter permease [Gammaproteobacteria bacterium]